MTKRKRMPVNVLQAGSLPERPDAVLDGLVGGSAAGTSGSVAPASTGADSRRVKEWLETRRLQRAEALVRARAGFSLFVGLLPWVPLSLAALVGLHLSSLRALAQVYDTRLEGSLLRGAVASLIATGGALLAARAGDSVFQVLSIAGWLTRAVCLGCAAWVSTYLLGRVFVKHFEAGETLLSLDPTATRDYFRRTLGDAPGPDAQV